MSRKNFMGCFLMKMLAVVPVIVMALALHSAAADKKDKKDIADPVLQEIINKFSSRMPRFISKHGSDIFVADAPLTRGGFMAALNEYDTSLKFNKKDYVSRQEFDDFKNKSTLIGKSDIKSDKDKEKDKDITQLINELQPNMPVLLDNSLNSSKVFNSLREEVHNGQFGGKSSVSRKEFDELSLKVTGSTGKSSSGSFDTLKISREIDELKNRVSNMESSKPSASKDRDMEDLKNRIGVLEAGMSSMPSSVPNDSNMSSQVSKTLTRVQQDLFTLKTKIESTEKKMQYSDSKGAVSKSEFDSVKDKVDILQQSIVGSKHGTSANYTNDEVLRKINYLNNSFAQVQKQGDQSFKMSQNASYDVNKVNGDVADLNATISRLRAQVARLEKKIDNIDLSSMGSGESSGSKSTLAKIGIGLGIVTAFLVAR